MTTFGQILITDVTMVTVLNFSNLKVSGFSKAETSAYILNGFSIYLYFRESKVDYFWKDSGDSCCHGPNDLKIFLKNTGTVPFLAQY